MATNETRRPEIYQPQVSFPPPPPSPLTRAGTGSAEAQLRPPSSSSSLRRGVPADSAPPAHRARAPPVLAAMAARPRVLLRLPPSSLRLVIPSRSLRCSLRVSAAPLDGAPVDHQQVLTPRTAPWRSGPARQPQHWRPQLRRVQAQRPRRWRRMGAGSQRSTGDPTRAVLGAAHKPHVGTSAGSPVRTLLSSRCCLYPCRATGAPALASLFRASF